MNKLFYLFLVLILSGMKLSGQNSQVLEGLSFHSHILNMERTYSVYLPPGYHHNDRYYPVLYLLHGSGGDHSTWIQSGEVQTIADNAILSGRVTPMIIVMPNARERTRGYFNHINGGFDYEDFFFNELIPHIEGTFRCRTRSRYRAISGQSMGGGGALFYTLHRPDMFSAAAPLSAATHSWNREQLIERLIRDEVIDVTDTQFENYFQRYSVPEILSAADSGQMEALQRVRWYISCGDEDFLYEGNCLLHIAFRKANIPHEFRIKDGGHTWSYWRKELPFVLEFVSKSFTEF